MTSSQPVATPNALHFTPDNKHCYAYSGEVQVTNSAGQRTMLEFITNSEYIVGRFSFGNADADFSGAKDIGYQINFNDVLIFAQVSASDSDGTMIYDGACFLQDIIIPPFTTVKITGFTTDTDNIGSFAMFSGKAFGMTDTGYQ